MHIIRHVLCPPSRAHHRDNARKAYISDGCGALPNPLPTGLSAAWPNSTSFRVSADAALASAWVASGRVMCSDPAADPSACCGQTMLDCSVPGAKVYIDVDRPLSVPAVACPPNAPPSASLVVFTGAGCQLHAATAGCRWNATLQTFEGAACVQDPLTYCACRCARAPTPQQLWMRLQLLLCSCTRSQFSVGSP